MADLFEELGAKVAAEREHVPFPRWNPKLLRFTMGLTAIAGEAAEFTEGAIFKEEPVTREKLLQFLKATLVEVAAVAHNANISLEEIISS